MTDAGVQFPAAVPGGRLKRAIRTTLGRLLTLVDPAAAARVAAGDLPARLGRRERLLIASLVARHAKAGTLDQLAPLHAWLWQGEQAVSFHQWAQARFDSWWTPYHAQIVVPLRSLIERDGSPYHSLCEIGCGSGLILEDLARRLPTLRSITGLDLSASQTRLNRSRRVDPRIRFEHGDACQWIPRQGGAGTVYLTVAGVFEYFSRDSLQSLFALLAQQQAPAVIALIEPIAANHDLDQDPQSHPYGFENSVGHNYRHLLREAGFELHFLRRQHLEGQMFLLLVAECRG